MIYVIYILIALLVAAIVIISDITGQVKWLKKRNDDLKGDIQAYQKSCQDYEQEIWCLVEGGLIQKEAVEIKYKKRYKDEKDRQALALNNINRYRQRHMQGLASLGGPRPWPENQNPLFGNL